MSYHKKQFPQEETIAERLEFSIWITTVNKARCSYWLVVGVILKNYCEFSL